MYLYHVYIFTFQNFFIFTIMNKTEQCYVKLNTVVDNDTGFSLFLTHTRYNLVL